MDTYDRHLYHAGIQHLIRKARIERDVAAAEWLAELMAAAVRAATRIGGPAFRRARSTDLPY